MINFTQQLKEEVDLKLREIESCEKNVIRRALRASELFEGIFDRLKAYISRYDFESEEEEILFFKEIKPRFFCHLIYYQKVFNLEMNRPMGSLEAQADYLNRELDAIQEYADKRLDFYRYYRVGHTHLDRWYFMRGRRDPEEQYRDSFYFERDPVFSTSCDFKVAKILSNDMLQVYIREELDLIDRRKYSFQQTPAIPANVPRWTDKKTRLIELIYGIDTMSSVEGGSISLKQLQQHVEQTFGVSLGNISRAFAEMRLRSNPVEYLHDMAERLAERMRTSEERNNSRHSGR